jgi:hypothetical protein
LSYDIFFREKEVLKSFIVQKLFFNVQKVNKQETGRNKSIKVIERPIRQKKKKKKSSKKIERITAGSRS